MPLRARVTFSYTPKDQDIFGDKVGEELELRKGDEVILLWDQPRNGKFLGRVNGKEGTIPEMYIRILGPVDKGRDALKQSALPVSPLSSGSAQHRLKVRALSLEVSDLSSKSKATVSSPSKNEGNFSLATHTHTHTHTYIYIYIYKSSCRAKEEYVEKCKWQLQRAFW